MPHDLAIAGQFETVRLGEGRLLVGHDSDGAITAIKSDVMLSVEQKEIVVVKGNPVITASGYDKLNRIAGINIVLPKRIDVPNYGGQPNPFYIIDQATQSIRFVMAKMSAIGYSPSGALCVVDQTLLFDLESYFKMDCLAKIRKVPHLGRLTHKDSLSEKELKQGIFKPILDENFGIWVDMTHKESQNLVIQHQQRIGFAERIALSILRRNCLKHHPAIGVTNVKMTNGNAVVPIMTWHKSIPESQLRALADKPEERDASIASVSTIITTDALAQEDMQTSSAEMQNSESAAAVNISKDIKFTEPEIENNDTSVLRERDKLLSRIEQYQRMMLPSKWTAFWSSKVTSGRDLTDFSDEELQRFLLIVERYLFQEEDAGK